MCLSRSRGPTPAHSSSTALRRFVRHHDIRLAFEPLRHRQFFLAKKARVEKLRLITGAVIGQHGHYYVARAKLLGRPHGPRHVDARRAAETKAFMLQEIEND